MLIQATFKVKGEETMFKTYFENESEFQHYMDEGTYSDCDLTEATCVSEKLLDNYPGQNALERGYFGDYVDAFGLAEDIYHSKVQGKYIDVTA